jgi:glycine oxidase
MTDCCIIGGGIIGLSIARELAGRGLSVRVLARDASRDTASWAAAGIFPPAPDFATASAHDRLTAYADRLHRTWGEELRAETGIDNELEQCGGLHLAGNEQSAARLREAAASWRAKGARCDELTAHDVATHEPALRAAVEQGRVVCGLLLPEEMRIRPPRHLEALLQSCRVRGVEITEAADVRSIDVRDGRIEGIRIARSDGGAATHTVRADRYCLAAGAWSGDLAASLGLHIETRPIRGQIALLRLPEQVLTRVVNVGLEYLVPRADGRLLVGSTIEDAGFEKITTPQTIQRLLEFARRLLGPLPDAMLEQSWAGLRPGSVDGCPFIGAAPACSNAFVAAGHFRAGLHQSTGTAVLLADLMTGRTPALDTAPFAPNRRPEAGSPDSVQAYLARAAEISA